MSDIDVVEDDFGVRSSLPALREMHPTITYINEAGVPEQVAEQVVGRQEVASAIERWMRTLNRDSSTGRTYDVFNRRNYSSSNHIFAQIGQCAAAVEEDDILSTLSDVVEGLAFQKMRFEMDDEDQEDIWNQVAADLDMDSRLREMWRELFKVSQVYVGVWWEKKIYTVRTKPELPEMDEEGNPKPEKKKKGNRKRKKQFPVVVPTDLTIFDPTKVVPVGQLMFGRERFAYIADEDEHQAFSQVMKGDIVDDVVLRLLERQYTPTVREQQLFQNLDIPWRRLWLFKRESCFRHTLTKSTYERWAPLRLKSALPLLEMKEHLRGSDRATLIGNTNFIVVIKKGTDKLPAKPAEIANLKEQARVVARMPILVGDHRLSVEIVTPTLDNTLIESRYQVLDARLVFKGLQTFHPQVQGGTSGGGQIKEMSRIVARGMESRRHQLARSIQGKLLKVAVELNAGVLDEVPTMTFMPKRISLSFNAEIVNAVLKVRDHGDLSRETALEELDYDQDVEARRRIREKEGYDEIFQSQVPFGSPASNPFSNGTQGGRPQGSGGVPKKQAESAQLIDALEVAARIIHEHGEELD